MRYLKRLVTSVLIYVAVYLPFIAILQAVSGGDFTAAYSAGGIVSAVELALGAVIEITKKREEAKINKQNQEENKDGQDQLETETGSVSGGERNG